MIVPCRRYLVANLMLDRAKVVACPVMRQRRSCANLREFGRSSSRGEPSILAVDDALTATGPAGGPRKVGGVARLR